MTHYRKVDTRIALDRKFNTLSRDSKLVFFHLLTHLHLTSLGVIQSTLLALAGEMDFSLEEFERAFHALIERGMVRFDAKARFIWLPNFLKYNPPRSLNVVKSWSKVLAGLPRCLLRELLMSEVKRFVQGLSVPFQMALGECFNREEG